MMDAKHYQALQALKNCTFLPGSWEKRFVRDVGALGCYDLLTQRQAVTVERTAHRYRKQIGRDMFPDAGQVERVERSEERFERHMQDVTGEPEPRRFRHEGYHTHPIWPMGKD